MAARFRNAAVLATLVASSWALRTEAQTLQSAKATSYPVVAPVLPTAQVSASTSGQATAKASADILFGSGNYNLAFTPTLMSTTQDGLSNLFSFKSDEVSASTPWQAGLGFSLAYLGPLDTMQIERNETPTIKKAARLAYAMCLAVCQPPAKGLSDEDRKFCLRFGPSSAAATTSKDVVDPGDLSQGEFCTIGNDFMVETLDKAFDKKYGKKTRDRISEYPQWDLSVGVATGTTRFKYLDQTATPLSDTTRTRWGTSGAIVWTYVAPTKDTSFTFEAPLVVVQKYKAQDKTASWCTPAGAVPRPDGSGATDPAQVCTTRPLGAPADSAQLTGALLFGVVSKPKAFWRVSIGPTASYTWSSDDSYKVGLEAPLYLSFVNVSSDEYVGEYKGLLRITPSVSIAHTVKGTDPEVFVTLEVLGKRSLFLRALDWL